MEKNNKTIIVGLVALIIGIAIGHVAGGYREAHEMYANNMQNVPNGMHQMSNGQLLGNGAGTNDADGDKNMQGMMANMNVGLVGKTGDAFDQAFLSEMIVHHQGAVQMAQLALTNAKHQEIKDLAKGIIEAQNKEIGEMQGWEKAWYGR